MTGLPELPGGPFLRTTPGTKVTFYPDGVQFTDPDGTVTWKPYPLDDDDDNPADDI